MIYLLLGSLAVNCLQGMFAVLRGQEVTQLKSEVSDLQARIPRHDAKGRFAKRHDDVQ